MNQAKTMNTETLQKLAQIVVRSQMASKQARPGVVE
jgi:hypothetical protein